MRGRTQISRLASGLALGLVAILFAAGGAGAATIVVARTDDPPNGSFDDLGCTLRDAVQAANTNVSAPNGCNGDNAGADTIVLQGGQTYTLTEHGVDDTNLKGDLDITGPVTIRSAGPGLATIDASSNFGLPSPPPGADRAVQVLPSAGAVTLEGLRIRNGLAESHKPDNGGGGGILNEAQLTVRGSEVLQNRVRGGHFSFGAGIYSRGTLGRLTVVDSTITANNGFAVEGSQVFGGGIAANESSPSLAIVNTTVSGNSLTGFDQRLTSFGGGAGVFGGFNPDPAVVTLTNDTIADNHSFDETGGVYLFEGKLTGNLIAGNTEERSNKTPDCQSESVTSGGGNLLGNSGTRPDNCVLTASTDRAGTVAAPIDPNLGLLVDNGGLTRTQVPNPGNPAIDLGGPCPETDQRGLFRAAAPPCDAGAVEVGATVAPPTASAPPPASSPAPVPAGPAPNVPAPTAPVAPISPSAATRTGKRAAALKRCKMKKTAKARRVCRRKAHKLPR
jgi:hypothetical protein